MSRHRKKYLCTGIGGNTWRVMKQGNILAGPELAAFVREIIFRLQDAQGIGDSQRARCSWGGWAVRGVLEDRHVQRLSCEASARLIIQIRQEKAESRGSLGCFLSRVGTSSFAEYVRCLEAV